MSAARCFLVFMCVVGYSTRAVCVQGGEEEALRLYDKAYSFYEKGKLKKAGTHLERLLEKYPEAEVAPLGLYLQSKIREQLGEDEPSAEKPSAPPSKPSPGVQEPPSSSPRFQTEAIRPAQPEQLPPPPPAAPAAEGVRITVAQVPGVSLRASVDRVDVRCGTEVEIPFQLTNTGNGSDRFALSNGTGHKGLTLRVIGEDGAPLSQTRVLKPGESLEGRIVLGLAEGADDEVAFEPVLVASSLHDDRIKGSVRISVTGRRPRLACSAQPDRAVALPGQELSWRVQAGNKGSVRAVSVDVTCQYPGELSLVSSNPEPTARDDALRQLTWRFDEIVPAQSFQADLRFRLSPRALAGEELFLWISVSSQLQKAPQAALSQPVRVGYVPGVAMEVARTSMAATPGDVLMVPVEIVNLGNGMEEYEVALEGIPGAMVSDEGVEIASSGGLPPTARADVKVRIQIPGDVADGQRLQGTITARAKSGENVAAREEFEILVSAPRIDTVTGVLSSAGRPGGSFHYVIQVSNNGSGLAKDVVIQETYQEGLRFMSASPMASEQGTNTATWNIAELEPGATVQISVQAGIAAELPAGAVLGTNTAVQWRDINGNVYP